MFLEEHDAYILQNLCPKCARVADPVSELAAGVPAEASAQQSVDGSGTAPPDAMESAVAFTQVSK